jgi:integrase
MPTTVASLHKQPGKPNWFCAYTTQDGQRHFKSTGTASKKQAEAICSTWAKASLHGDKLNADKAREIIAAGVADVMAASGGSLPSATVREWCKRWLTIKEVENEATSHTRYKQAIRVFLDFIGSAGDRNLESLTPNTLLEFRDDCSQKVSTGTANTNLRIVRSCLNAAQQQGLLGSNPASRVKFLKERGQGRRREMTLEEIRRVLKVCGDTPWRGLVLTGLYTGQRLGDCARLTWQQVDLMNKTISFVTRKTGKRLSMRIADPLADYLSGLPGVDDPRAFVFPVFAGMGENVTASLSKAFAEEILIPAGLMLPRPKHHASAGRGRRAKRQVNEVTYHSLRHSFVTMLKATGASNAIAQMIVGHDSAAVNAHYTHLSAGDTEDAISKLSDVTKKTPSK